MGKKISDLPAASSIAGSELIEIVQSGVSKSVTAAALASGASSREMLTADRTYYVRADGNDANNGLSNTSGGAFLTLQKAIDVATSLDFGIRQLTIQVADGTYTGACRLKPYIGALPPIIQGNTATPANCIISTTSNNCFYVDTLSSWITKGFKLQTTTSGFGLSATNSGTISFANIDFGVCAGGHMNASINGSVFCTSNYTISGSAPVHWQVTEAGIMSGLPGKTLTLTGTPAFAVAFLYMRTGGVIVLSSSMIFTGSATGSRYNISLNSACFVNGASTTYLPGNASGSTSTGGQYV